MIPKTPLTDLSVAEVLSCWPETAQVFNRHNMGCAGCALAPFYGVIEVAAIYGLSEAGFLAELQQVIEKTADDRHLQGVRHFPSR